MVPPAVGTSGTDEIPPLLLQPLTDKSSRSWLEQVEPGTRVGNKSSLF
jgi:hypothetical protein